MPARVTKFHSIMPLANIPSVLQRGILSHARAVHLQRYDISMQAIQERRDKVRVPGGMWLHQYANLYFHARNPMLFKRLQAVNRLCILRISVDVLEISGTVITDQNASSNYVRFLPPQAIRQLDFDQIYAADWRHPGNPIAYYRHKSQKCAEVLVPRAVPPEYIFGAYVVDDVVQATLHQMNFPHPIKINAHLFFR
ncbi:MAG: DUF4433 domain-containing protein [Anaerolineales bacterium]|nr:DUF4433 domain-containing protein [Anaerolineales bacterium]